MNVIQYCIQKVAAELEAAGKPVFLRPTPDWRPAKTPEDRSESARTREDARAVLERRREEEARAVLERRREEEARLAEIERRREAQLLREAEADVRRRRIARCHAEIKWLESRPADTPEKAYLVTMGVEDWRAEMRAIEAEGSEQA